MSRIFKNVMLLCMATSMFFASCKKQEFEDYYARPDNLADPIYQQLQARGNFTSLLKCIDKAGYKASLSAGGYWTIFAADDEAFKLFLAEKGVSSVDELDTATVREIVTYNLVYNAYSKDELLKYQAPGQSNAPVQQVAFKRKTAFYDFVYTSNVNNKNIKVINTNRNGATAYAESDNGNKYTPYFITEGLSSLGITPTEYSEFYPGSTFDSFNIGRAKVTEKDIPAENGLIHIINRVVLPPKNLDGYIASKSEYSEFKKLLDLAASYNYNASVTKRYQAISRSMDSVFVKSYNSSLAFAPNNENFITSGTDAQIQGYTMFVPTNAQLLAYSKKILTYYGSFKAAPPSILYDFLNAHMWLSTVWPNKLSSQLNVQGETPTFNATTFYEKKILSNGIFYGINAVQDADVFRTIYSYPYLNPSYNLMTRALDGDGIKSIIKIPAAKYTMFMISNTQFKEAGYDYYEDRSNWGFLAPNTTGTVQINDNSKARVFRILETSVLPTLNGELNDLSGKGIVEAYNGEYVKFNAGKVYASGNEETNTPVTIDSSKTAVNGKVYYTKGILNFSEQAVPYTIEQLAAKDPSTFGHFWNYLKNSSIYTEADRSILRFPLGAFYTILIPSNAAIEQAVKDGILPGNTTTGVPNFTSTTPLDVDKVQKFFYYHVLDKQSVASDGKKYGDFQTLLKNVNGEVLTVKVVSPSKDNLSFVDWYNRTSTINLNKSNNLGNRAVIHSLNNYLKYNDQ